MEDSDVDQRFYLVKGYTDRHGVTHRSIVWTADFRDGQYVVGSLRRWHWKNHRGQEIPDDGEEEPSLQELF